MLRQAVIGAEQLVIHRLGYKFAVSQEKAFLTGTGVNQQLGVHAIASGISTDRDVSTGNTTTAIGFDGLIEAKFSIKSQYWRNATWLFHRDAIKGISKLKDGQGQYLWSQSVREGEPDRILGMPMVVSEFVPNTFDRQVCRSVRRL
jgi:HK97 family phage major capsid protein